MTYDIKLLSCFVSLVFNKSGLFNALRFLMMSSMSAGGYLCFNRYDFNSSSLVIDIYSSETIIFNRQANL